MRLPSRCPSAISFLFGALVLCLPQPAQAAPLFPNPVYVTGHNPYGLAVADFNRDGIQDLVVANFEQGYDGGTGTLSLFLGHGDGTFADGVLIPTSQHPSDVLAADLNGDGVGDLLVQFYASGEVVVMLGRGNGTFRPETLVASAVYRMRWADFNDDAAPDLFVEVAAADGPFRALLGRGDGTFDVMPAVDPGPLQDAINIDFNGDGRDDVVVLRYISGEDPKQMVVFQGAGDGSFVQAGAFTADDYVAGMTVADLDGDGREDLGVEFYHPRPSGSNEDFAPYYSVGDGTFVMGPKEMETYTSYLIAYDRNGDGIQDYVRIGVDGVIPYLGQGNRTFSRMTTFYTGSEVRGVVTGDFERDGRLDLAILANQGEAVFIYAGNATGSYGPHIDTTLRDSYPGGVVTDDFNGDGKLDIAAVVLDQNQVAIELGHGDGSFGAPTYFPAGMGGLLLAGADMNHDGHLDLVVADRNWDNPPPDPIPPGFVSILIGNGDGTFHLPATYQDPALLTGNAMHVRDLDGDGTPDVVVAGYTDYNGNVPPDLAYFHGNADGTLATPVHLSAGTENEYPYGWTFPMAVDSGDFDHDGLRDIVVAVSGLPFAPVPVAGTARILRGLGGGAFSSPITVGTGSNIEDVAVADLDGDGDEDIAVANPSTHVSPDYGGLYVLANDGMGAFTQSALIPAGFAPSEVQVADMTGDGVPDLVASTNGNYLSILPGTGGGQYAPQMNFGYFAALALLTGDFDSNGFKDFVVVSSSGVVFFGNQTATPTALHIDAKISFTSPLGRGSGTITWTTNAESDLVWFNVVQLGSSGRVQVNRAPIPCIECTSGLGHTYNFYVPKHGNGKNFYIEAIHADHTVEVFGPAKKN
jgi:hypothetical protein